ncbi:MAG: magnesium transporter [Elusimicrobia bacterium]|jgi:magnesium transporter|nr:magnesium transporter [Elusimicrobiota bacterium]
MSNNIDIYIPDIKAAIAGGDKDNFTVLVNYLPAVDIAEGWNKLSLSERMEVFLALKFDRKVELFERIDLTYQREIIKHLRTGALGPILNEMASDERVDLFEKLSKEKLDKLFSLMKDKEVEDVNNLMSYGYETAGGKMTTEYVALKPGMTARAALLTLQKSLNTKEVKNVYALYSTDSSGRLIGGISLQRLIATGPDEKISDIAKPVDNIKVDVTMDQEDVARLFTHYDLLSVPVVDENDLLLGVITIDDIVDVIHQEATEDIVKMAGTESEELLSESVLQIFKIRWPWLFVSWIGGLLTMGIVGAFQDTLGQVLVIAAFIPVIMGMGGNVGVQSSTIVVRGLAIGNIDLKKIWVPVFKQMKVGFVLGLSYGIMMGLIARIRYPAEGVKPLFLGIVVSAGMCLSMTIASTLGAIMPIIFEKMNIDPAVATGPFVTTATDAISLTTYLLLSTFILL